MISALEQRAIAVQVFVVISLKPFISAVSLKPSIADTFSLDISYRSEHIDAHDALVFISVRMKKYYNAKYTLMFFKVEEHVHLRLHRGYQMIDI